MPIKDTSRVRKVRNVNRIVLIARISEEARLHETPDKARVLARCKIRITGTVRTGWRTFSKQRPMYVHLAAWNDQAPILLAIKKGEFVRADGYLTTRTILGTDGKPFTYLMLNAEKVEAVSDDHVGPSAVLVRAWGEKQEVSMKPHGELTEAPAEKSS